MLSGRSCLLKRFSSTNVEREVSTFTEHTKFSQIEDEPGLRNATMLGVVGPLIKFVNGLPTFARQTRDITPKHSFSIGCSNSADPMDLV